MGQRRAVSASKAYRPIWSDYRVQENLPLYSGVGGLAVPQTPWLVNRMVLTASKNRSGPFSHYFRGADATAECVQDSQNI